VDETTTIIGQGAEGLLMYGIYRCIDKTFSGACYARRFVFPSIYLLQRLS